MELVSGGWPRVAGKRESNSFQGLLIGLQYLIQKIRSVCFLQPQMRIALKLILGVPNNQILSCSTISTTPSLPHYAKGRSGNPPFGIAITTQSFCSAQVMACSKSIVLPHP